MGSNVSALCLDGFDFMPVVAEALSSFYELQPSVQHDRFVEMCQKLGLPLNKSKRVLAAMRATIRGGELCDRRLGLPASKVQGFWWKIVGIRGFLHLIFRQ